MGQQEDFRTPGGGHDVTADAPPIFNERSARRAAPVVPLEKIARRQRFARWAGGWRETVRSPQFRRSWPLALLVVATLAAAVAAMSIYNQDGTATGAVPITNSTADEPAAGASAADSAKSVATPARNEFENSRDVRRGDVVGPDAATAGNAEAFAASALGSFLGGEPGKGEQGGAAASARDERASERDKGKRQKRSKRHQGARRNGGGAVLFDVIR